MKVSRTSSRIGLAAGLVGGSVGLALLTGFGPAPALSSASSGQPSDDSTTSSTTSSTSTTVGEAPAAPATAASRVVDAGGAGTVTVAQAGRQLSLVDASPATGWTVEVEQSSGPEVEVDFRRGGQRVQVNVELEDGAIRERVRFRDDATGTDLRVENGAVVRADVADDHGGSSGSDDSGHDATDDHGGDSGSGGSGRGGADDPSGDDHGSDDD